MLENPLVATAEARAAAHVPVSAVGAVARARLLTVAPETLLTAAATLLSSAEISLVVVCDAAGAVVGVITETILVHALGLGRADLFTTPASAVMSRDYNTCAATDSLADVLSTMHRLGLIHVVIVDAANRPEGVLNARDGLRVLLATGNQEEALLRSYVTGAGYR